MKRAIATGAAMRRWWAVVLVGLWFVACLNPMPDDFPNDRGVPVIGPSDNPSGTPEDGVTSPSVPGASDPDDCQCFSEGEPGQGAGGTGNAPPAGSAGSGGASIGADAGPPEADAGP